MKMLLKYLIEIFKNWNEIGQNNLSLIEKQKRQMYVDDNFWAKFQDN